MQLDHFLPPHDWSKPITVEALINRARVLAPLTLADAPPWGLENLAELIEHSPQGDVPEEKSHRGRVSDQLLKDMVSVWKADPRTGTRGSEPGDAKPTWTAPEELFTKMAGGRNQIERKKARDDWAIIRWFALRRLVAAASTINGETITTEGLRQEREDIAHLFDLLLSAEDDPDSVTDVIDGRLLEAGPIIKVSLESDHIHTVAHPPFGDLGAHNTLSLVALFQKYPLAGLGRCEHDECGWLYLPGAEGRKRTYGQHYCSAYCLREATAKNRRSS